MVMPGNEGLCDSFAVFDGFIKAVNNARRNARDLLTDKQLDKLDDTMAGEEATQEWRYVALLECRVYSIVGGKF